MTAAAKYKIFILKCNQLSWVQWTSWFHNVDSGKFLIQLHLVAAHWSGGWNMLRHVQKTQMRGADAFKLMSTIRDWHWQMLIVLVVSYSPGLNLSDLRPFINCTTVQHYCTLCHDTRLKVLCTSPLYHHHHVLLNILQLSKPFISRLTEEIKMYHLNLHPRKSQKSTKIEKISKNVLFDKQRGEWAWLTEVLTRCVHHCVTESDKTSVIIISTQLCICPMTTPATNIYYLEGERSLSEVPALLIIIRV